MSELGIGRSTIYKLAKDMRLKRSSKEDLDCSKGNQLSSPRKEKKKGGVKEKACKDSEEAKFEKMLRSSLPSKDANQLEFGFS